MNLNEVVDAALATSGKGYLGIDPSLNATGWCYLSSKGAKYGVIKGKAEEGYARLNVIYRTLLQTVLDCKPEVSVTEGYSLGSRSGSMLAMGEVGGVVRLALDQYDMTYDREWFSCPPTSMKLFIANHGRAEKEEVGKEVNRQFAFDPIDIPKGIRHNVVDAYGLAVIAALLDAPGSLVSELDPDKQHIIENIRSIGHGSGAARKRSDL